jgi:membrane fusion protein, multidrug efflux system
MARIHIAVASTALFTIGINLGCSTKQEAAPARSPVPVKVKEVTKASEVALSRYSGSLEPASRVDMAFRVGGYVEMLAKVKDKDGQSRDVAEGDFVARGTVLARIRSADYAQRVASARASINQARSEEKLAEAELARAEKLFSTNAISRAELDAKVARAENARANVEAATARAGEASVALDDTVLKAPMDGVILSRDLEVGTLVSPGRPVLAIADIGTVKVTFAVPEALVERLSVGSPLSVHVGTEREATAEQRSHDARVTRIAPAADEQGRVFSVEAELPNPDGALKPGTVISVRVPEATLARASLSVPLSAVVRSPKDPRGFAVFVVDGREARAKVRLTPVKLGQVLGNSVTVENGLGIGQRVVTVGSTLVEDGSDTVVIP